MTAPGARPSRRAGAGQGTLRRLATASRTALTACCTLLAVLLPTVSQAAATVPGDFDRTEVISGLDAPTAFRFAPGGRIFIAQQDGAIRLVRNGVLQPDPMVTLPAYGADERGLLGIEVDPDFTTNGYIYAAYTHSDTYDRLSRFTVTGDTIALSSEKVLLKSNQAANLYHHGGEVRFGPDGKLYWGLGINLYHPNAPNLGSLHGKILRINPDGSIPADNPFVDTPGAQPPVWAYGLRNPFRFTMIPNGPNAGRPLAGDVGGSKYEELDLIRKGGDYGWPDAEGTCTGCPYAQPVFAYPHTQPPASAGSISSVAVYTGSTFPAQYRNAVFYADYTLGFIKYLKMDDEYESVISDNMFDAGAGTSVQLETGPDGNLYQLTIYPGVLFKIAPSGGNRTPVAQASAAPDNGLAPLNVQFSATGSADPDGDPLTYAWDFKDGTTSDQASPSHVFTANGTYGVTLTVSDGTKTDTTTVPVSVGNRRPTGVITSPADTSKYDAGDTISYTATGADPEDGTLPATAFSWTVIFHHADHVHPFLGPIDGVRSGTFTIPRNADNMSTTWYEIQLTVRDSAGLTQVSSVGITPNLTNLTFSATPAGARYTIDGLPYTGTHTEQAVVGVERVLSAPSPQSVNGTQYTFAGWSGQGAQTHTITTPSSGASYQVSYAELVQPPDPWVSTDVGARTAAGSSAYNNGTFTITGSGTDIWGTDDEFRYVHQPLSGDGSIVARVTSQSHSQEWAKSGIMIKESTAAGAKYAAVLVSPEHGMRFQHNFSGDSGGQPYSFPNAWMKLTRAGDVLTAYRSADGSTWTPIGTTTLAMSTDVTVGLFVCAHNDAAMNTTVFDNVTVQHGNAVGPPPAPWRRVDVGGAAPDGSASYDSTTGTFTVNGGGTDVWGPADQMSYLWRPLSGDGSITARITSQEATDGWAKAGVVIKASASSASPYASMLISPANGSAFQWDFAHSTSGGPLDPPNAWVRLTRTGNLVSGFRSANGADWTLVGQATIDLPASATMGLFVNAHNGGTSLGTATFDHVVTTATSPWVSEDVGGPALAGSSSESGRTFTVTGAGTDVWGDQDQFHFVHQSLDGDGSIVARVTSQDHTNGWAKAGIMIKASATAGTPYVALMRTPDHGVNLQGSGPRGIAGGTAGRWLKLTRSGSIFTGYESSDGASWTRTGSLTVAMPDGARAGLFVTSHDAGTLGTATIDNVSVIAGPDTALPAGWLHGDIGGPALRGGAGGSGQTFTVTGAGSDIWGAADQFHYAYRTLTGDGTITARVVTQEDTDPWAKSGLMVKASATAGAPYVAIMATPGNGVHVQSDFTSDTDGGPGTVPIWLRLTRAGDTVAAYRSTDGSTWTQVTTRTLAGPATIGLFVTSHDAARLNTTTFDGVTIT